MEIYLFLKSIWASEIQLFPVVLALIVTEIPALLRYFFRIPYVPVYFLLFPFNVLNKDISIYLNQDYFLGEGEDLSSEDLLKIRKKVINKGLVSICLSLGIIPFFCGFFCAFFMPAQSFVGFSILFIFYKSIGILKSAIDFHTHGVSNLKTMTLYFLIYASYFLCFILIFKESYYWTIPYVESEKWMDLIGDLTNFVVIKVVFSIIIITILYNSLINQILKPENRK